MTERSNKQNQQLHVVMFPYLAFGHISPFVQLSNKLSMHNMKISFLTPPSNISRIQSSLTSPSDVNFIPLTIPPVPGLPPDLESTAKLPPHLMELLKKSVNAMKPQVQTILSSLRPDVIIFDFGQPWIPSIASPLNIKSLFFSVFAAVATAFITVPCRISGAGKAPSGDDLKHPPPGFPPSSSFKLDAFEARDIEYVFKHFDGGPSVFECVIGCISDCSGIIVKSCPEMEGPYIEFVEAQFGKPILLAGPMVPSSPIGDLEPRWADWLGKFQANSVVFCSFGSETFLSNNQIQELLLGLEMTGSPFLVVLNFPEGDDPDKRLKAAVDSDYWERVKHKGLVHVGWVQQLHILAHTSVGCYVCHGGLSSVMEAIANGSQVVLLPQKGDQFLNSRLVASNLKAGVRVKREDDSGFFRKEDLYEAIDIVTKKAGQEPGRTIVENCKKWREFLKDGRVHDRFIKSLVEKVEEMVFGDVS